MARQYRIVTGKLDLICSNEAKTVGRVYSESSAINEENATQFN